MIERKLFQDTFSALHASEKSIQEVLAMSEEKKNTAARFRRPRRALLTAAAVMASLCVCAGAANAATDGALAQAIELHIAQAFQINEYKDVMETEEGTTIVTYGADVRVTQENGRIFLYVGQEALDITDALERDGTYTYEDTDGDTTLRVVITPDDKHPGEWAYSVSYLDPALKEGGAVSFSLSSNERNTSEKNAATVPTEPR